MTQLPAVAAPAVQALRPAENPLIRARDIAYLIFEKPDLDRQATFLTDFGLTRLPTDNGDEALFRGSGPSPFNYVVRRGRRSRFVGLAFEAAEAQDLDRVSRSPDAGSVTVSPRPGGGRVVSLTDPNGFQIDVVHGRQPDPCAPRRAAYVANAYDRPVRVNAPHRPERAAPKVLRLGHAVLETPFFTRCVRWYTEHFGLTPSDVLHLDDGSPTVVFLRCDRGAEPSDHHTLVLGTFFEPAFNHAAFEVEDVDAIAMGQQVLRAGGHRHAWGVGRHLLGSQVFDYWSDPWGDKHEHFTDGDLFDASVPTGYHPFDLAGLYQWGPDVPSSFIDASMTPGRFLALLRNVRRSEDLSFARLSKIKAAASRPARPWMR